MAKQLTHQQRYYICLQIASGTTQTAIAKVLKVNKSTISREVKRNSRGVRDYDSDYAQKQASLRRSYASSAKRFKTITPKMESYIEANIKQKWSPEQISGRMKKDMGKSISHETIYSFIKQDRRKGGKLFKLLSHQGKKYKYGSQKSTIVDRVDISERPKIVEEKSRIGDLEVDTIVSAKNTGKGCLVTVVDRKSKMVFIRKTTNKTAHEIQKAIEDIYMNTNIPIITITSDNGTEFANHKEIANNIACKFFFARPYKSCDRGLNENTNGLIRKYLPKGTNFDLVSIDTIKQIENDLNNRPRKTLKYKTPNEIINKYLQRVSKSRQKQGNGQVAFQT